MVAIDNSAFDADPIRFAATFSIVARDAATGQIGVAVQSHYFSVGSSVSWAEAGVGAVATQAFGEPGYGPRGLELLRSGKSSKESLQFLLAEDAGREIRQVAMVDSAGCVAVHTGKMCVVAAEHGEGEGYSVQGNMLRSDAVIRTMGAAYEAADGDLAERMITALEVAEHAGGDVRGRQSAALQVVSGTRGDRPWEETQIDLRVDDHADPINELRRLLTIRRATQFMEQGVTELQTGDVEAALECMTRARELRPEDPQLQFWSGVALVHAGRTDEALEVLRLAYAADAGWRELLPRLIPLGIVPNDPDLIARLTGDSQG